MGWLYTRLVAFNSFADADLRALEDDMDDDADEESLPFMPQSRNDHLITSIHHFMAMCGLNLLRGPVDLPTLAGNCICKSS